MVEQNYASVQEQGLENIVLEFKSFCISYSIVSATFKILLSLHILTRTINQQRIFCITCFEQCMLILRVNLFHNVATFVIDKKRY